MTLSLLDWRERPRVISLGGGLSSFALLVDAVQRRERVDCVVFIDVGDPGHVDPAEWPGTYRHLREVVAPLCARESIHFEWLDTKRYPVRDARSLFAWLDARRQIPVAGPNRICTQIAKVERFEHWLSDTFPGREVRVDIGFEAGEEARAAKDPNVGHAGELDNGTTRVNRFPLIDRRLCRCRCEALVRAAGFPVPRKSACVMCPYATTGDFMRLSVELPDVFAEVARLEEQKPPTRNGYKLSIKNFHKHKDADGNVTGYTATYLPKLVKGTFRPRRQACAVCGAEQRATKATACGWLEAA